MANDIYYIGVNDEHGVNPPTPGKRTPVVPGLNRQIYENEINRATKQFFIESCMRNNLSVYDVKPELNDISISERIRRINRQNLDLLVTFAYNAFGENFNNASGVEVFYSPINQFANESKSLSDNIYQQLIQGTEQNGRGVKTLDVGVLSNVNCPSSLIEAGEARLMINPLFQIEVAEETCRGVCDYLNINYIYRNNLSNYPTTRRGNRSNFVYLLQFILSRNGYNLVVDGVFGSNTESVVRQFQEKNNLTVDGIVGYNTWKYLLTLPPYPTLRRGDSGIYVTLLQKLLESNLVSVGIIDGKFGPQTEDAVKSFQQNNNLITDGIVGKNTWSALTRL